MRHPLTARRALGALAACSLLLAACNSGASIQTSSPPPASAGPSGAASPAASVAPSAAPSSAGSPAASPGGSSAGGPIDLPGSAASLEELDRYKVVLTLEGGEQPGTGTLTTVRTPVLARSFEGDFGGTPLKVIIIGNDVWMDSGTGVWAKNPIPAIAAGALFGAFDPVAQMLGIGSWVESGALQQVGTEEKNGVQAVHYHLDSTTAPAGASFPPDMSVDLWVAAEGGYLVSVRTSGMPGDGGPTAISMDISNINDPALTITPPA
jgi:hypothetical protein